MSVTNIMTTSVRCFDSSLFHGDLFFSSKNLNQVFNKTTNQCHNNCPLTSMAWSCTAGRNLFSISVPPPLIPNAMWSRAGTSVRTCTDLSTMDFSAGHCPDALITLYYNLNLNTPLMTQGQCSWGNPSNVTQDDILMSLKCRCFKFLIFLTLTIIRLCPKKKKSSQISHISRNGNKSWIIFK